MRRLALLPLLLLAGCEPAGGGGYDLRYTGPLTLQSGERCPDGGPSTLTINSQTGAVLFTPDDGSVILPGHLAPSGAITARLNTSPPNHPAFPLELRASKEGDRVTGTYTTPLCRYRLALAPPQPPKRRIFAPRNPLGL